VSEEQRRPLVQPQHLQRCPFCHADVGLGDEPVVCAACLAKHHKACWFEDGGACATCGSRDGLGRLAQAPARAVEPRALRPAAFADLGERRPSPELRAVLDELRKYDGSMFRHWWFFLIPHVYIPIFWPFLLIHYLTETSAVRKLVEKAVLLERAEWPTLDHIDRETLESAADYAGVSL
jgi:hypothetical protein